MWSNVGGSVDEKNKDIKKCLLIRNNKICQ